jgi:hypothetical protein
MHCCSLSSILYYKSCTQLFGIAKSSNNSRYTLVIVKARGSVYHLSLELAVSLLGPVVVAKGVLHVDKARVPALGDVLEKSGTVIGPKLKFLGVEFNLSEQTLSYDGSRIS